MVPGTAAFWGATNWVRRHAAERRREVLQAKGGYVWAAAISASGRFAATGHRRIGFESSAYDCVVVWDLDQRRKVLRKRIAGGVQTLAFSPDDTRLLVGGLSPIARLINLEGKLVRELRCSEGWTFAVAFSSTNDRAIVCAGLPETPVHPSDVSTKLWNLKSGRSEQEFKHNAVAFSADARLALTWRLVLWDTATGQTRTKRDSVTNWTARALSPDGRVALASKVMCSDAGPVALWDPIEARPLAPLVGHTAEVWAGAFSGDGARVATGAGPFRGSEDCAVRIWDTRTARQLANLTGHTSAIKAVAISSDGRRIVAGAVDGAVLFWELAS